MDCIAPRHTHDLREVSPCKKWGLALYRCAFSRNFSQRAQRTQRNSCGNTIGCCALRALRETLIISHRESHNRKKRKPCLECHFARREPLPLPLSWSNIEAVKKLTTFSWPLAGVALR